MQRDPGACDGGSAGATIGLYNVAIEPDLAFAHGGKVSYSSQGPADQALNFLGPPALFAACCFAPAAGVG
jgi:hypothetical protein